MKWDDFCRAKCWYKPSRKPVKQKHFNFFSSSADSFRLFFPLLFQSIILDGCRLSVFLCSHFDYYVLQQQLNNTMHRPVGLKKFSPIFFFPFRSKYTKKGKKHQPKTTATTTRKNGLIRAKTRRVQQEKKNTVIEVQYLPDIKIEANKILLCATFISIGQRVSIRCVCC